MITTRHKLTSYGTSLAVVLGVHAIAIAIALHWSAPRTVQLPPAAMVIDLAPMPAPPPPAPPKKFQAFFLLILFTCFSKDYVFTHKTHLCTRIR